MPLSMQKVEASEGVYVQDGIMNSSIDATKEITCVGKRATIVGGRLRAGELIKSKTLGSSASVQTIIEVGIDPKKRQRLDELNEERDKAYKEKDPLDTNLSSLDNIRKGNKLLYTNIESLSFSSILKRLTVEEDRIALLSFYDKKESENLFVLKESLGSEEKKVAKDIVGKVGYLPPDKEEIYQKLQEQSDKLQIIIQKTQEEIEDIEKYLTQLKSSSKIVGSKIIYPGVRIYVKSAQLDIKTEYKKMFFYLQGAEVNVSPYTEEDKEDKKR